jgi:high affinity Mn2+ porin
MDTLQNRLILASLLLACAGALRADGQAPGWAWDGHFQVTAVPQYHPAFRAPYSGANSLDPSPEFDTSLTSTLFLGARILPGLELYCDPELVGGSGFSGTSGLADFPNGEIFRVSQAYPQVNVARLYLQWVLGLGGGVEDVAGAANQLPGPRPRSRLTLAAGDFSLTDFFDDNAYSHDPRSQFLNWSLMDNGAWDYAADTHGYTAGFYAELTLPGWALRAAEAEEPTTANGAVLDNDVIHARSENLEAEGRWSLGAHPGALRALGFWNHADMGSYTVSLASAASAPDITQSRARGNEKYGFGWSFEQEILQDLACFSRAGWNNGRTETWAFTEIDQSASAGLALSGGAWKRDQDHAGLAYVISGLSDAHLEYLAAGGHGFIVGDGALRYAPEQVLEAYYSWCPVQGLTLSPDYQYFQNPAYNQARGPVHVLSVRAHFEL